MNMSTKMVGDMFFGSQNKDSTLKVLKGLEQIAQEMGVSQAQLSLAWVLANKDVSVAIFGASKVQQVEENIKAVEVLGMWSRDLEEWLNELLGNQPMITDVWNKIIPRR